MSNSQHYKQYTDENGETYYCPLNAFDGSSVRSDWAQVNCVETSIADRYAGDLKVVH